MSIYPLRAMNLFDGLKSKLMSVSAAKVVENQVRIAAFLDPMLQFSKNDGSSNVMYTIDIDLYGQQHVTVGCKSSYLESPLFSGINTLTKEDTNDIRP
jgi:hypothetical protein